MLGSPRCVACCRSFDICCPRHHCHVCGHEFCSSCSDGTRSPRTDEARRLCHSCSVGQSVVRVAFEQDVIGLNFGAASWPGIESIRRSSAAEGRLRVGMILVEIQGVDIRGKTMEDASEELKAAGRPLGLAFLSPEAQLDAVV